MLVDSIQCFVAAKLSLELVFSWQMNCGRLARRFNRSRAES